MVDFSELLVQSPINDKFYKLMYIICLLMSDKIVKSDKIVRSRIPPHLMEWVRIISPEHKVARLTDYHIGESGIFGFLDIALCGTLGGDGCYPRGYDFLHIWGEIEIPATAVDPLKELKVRKGADYFEVFRKDFGVSERASSRTSFKYANAPFREGVKYYSANHPNNIVPETDKEAFLMQVSRAEVVMIGYIQRMEQWISQTLQRKLRSSIEYEGLAKVIHERQITCTDGNPHELARGMYQSRLLSPARAED